MQKYIYLVNIHYYENNEYFDYAFSTEEKMLEFAKKQIDERVDYYKINDERETTEYELDRKNWHLWIENEGRIDCHRMELDTWEGTLL